MATFGAALDKPLAPEWRPPPGWGAAECALVIALAEGLGYGRDRAALRACGERLARGDPPDALLSETVRLGAVERAGECPACSSGSLGGEASVRLSS